MSVRDLIIIGAGPTGLSAAIAAKTRNLDYQVIEQGTLVNSIYRFPPQMVFFTTPELLEIGGLPFVSPYEKPTRTEALRYYRKVVDAYDLQIAFDETVWSIQREQEGNDRGFAVQTRSSRGEVQHVHHGKPADVRDPDRGHRAGGVAGRCRLSADRVPGGYRVDGACRR